MVSNISYFHPYLGKNSNLNIFQMGWNQPVYLSGLPFLLCFRLQDLDGKLQVIEADTAEQQRKVQSLEAWRGPICFVLCFMGWNCFGDGIELLGMGFKLLIPDGKDWLLGMCWKKVLKIMELEGSNVYRFVLPDQKAWLVVFIIDYFTSSLYILLYWLYSIIHVWLWTSQQ